MKGSKSRVCLAYPASQYVGMHRPILGSTAYDIY